jgi:hypothetical protein
MIIQMAIAGALAAAAALGGFRRTVADFFRSLMRRRGS